MLLRSQLVYIWNDKNEGKTQFWINITFVTFYVFVKVGLMERFLRSLEIRANETASDVVTVSSRNRAAEAEFRTLRTTAGQLLFSRNPSSSTTLANETQQKKRRSRSQHTETAQPLGEYTPASRYPLPLSPVEYRIKHGKGASKRTFGLYKMRKGGTTPTDDPSSPPPSDRSVPEFTIAPLSLPPLD